MLRFMTKLNFCGMITVLHYQVYFTGLRFKYSNEEKTYGCDKRIKEIK